MVSSTAYMVSDVCGHAFMTVFYMISYFWLSPLLAPLWQMVFVHSYHACSMHECMHQRCIENSSILFQVHFWQR